MKNLLIATVIAITASGGAWAQSTSGAVSGSAAYNDNTNAAGAIAAGNSVTYYGSPEQQNIKSTYGGSYDVRNVPSVSAPGIITAHNCSMGASVGGSGMGWGVSLGGTYVDEACQLVSQAAALNTLAGRSVAIRHLAKDPAMCDTLLAAGLVTGTCGRTTKRTKTDQVASVATKSSPSIKLTKCEKAPGNKVLIKYGSGADKVASRAACLASLGY